MRGWMKDGEMDGEERRMKARAGEKSRVESSDCQSGLRDKQTLQICGGDRDAAK